MQVAIVCWRSRGERSSSPVALQLLTHLPFCSRAVSSTNPARVLYVAVALAANIVNSHLIDVTAAAEVQVTVAASPANRTHLRRDTASTKSTMFRIMANTRTQGRPKKMGRVIKAVTTKTTTTTNHQAATLVHDILDWYHHHQFPTHPFGPKSRRQQPRWLQGVDERRMRNCSNVLFRVVRARLRGESPLDSASLLVFDVLTRSVRRASDRQFNLKGHIRSHNEERPFKCSFPGCEKSESDSTVSASYRKVSRVMLTDIESDSFRSGFARAHDAKRHSLLHAGKKPFECENCHRTFARFDALSRHRE